jgi:hypothetical protein
VSDQPPTDDPLGRAIPIRDYNPNDLGEEAYRTIARIRDEIRARKARHQAGGAA